MVFGRPVGRPKVEVPQQPMQQQQGQTATAVHAQAAAPQIDYAVWEVGTVAVQTEPVIVNPQTGETLQAIEGIVRILNYLEELKSLL